MKKYISTDRAAHVSGYTVDYVGQLCRSGKISCTLVDSEWAVDVHDLKEYLIKRQVSSHIQLDSEKTFSVVHDSKDQSIVIDEKKYISTTRAAYISSYSQDYIGQLVRSKKIESTQVNGRWFVLYDSLSRYIREQQALLLDQASNRVGFVRPERARVIPVQTQSLLRYSYDEVRAPLIPSPFNGQLDHVRSQDALQSSPASSSGGKVTGKIYNTMHEQSFRLGTPVHMSPDLPEKDNPLTEAMNSRDVTSAVIRKRSIAVPAMLATSVFFVTFFVGALVMYPRHVITQLPIVDALLSLTTASITVTQ